MAENERIISERVVSKRVIGSSNPVMRFGRNLKSSFSGILIGILLIIASLVGLVWGEHLDKDSKIIKDMPVLTAQEAAQKSGELVIIKGTPVVTKAIDGMILVDQALYYSYTIENLETKVVTEEVTETKEEEGKDVEYTKEQTKLVDEWVTEKDEKKWADFKIGGIDIDSENASLSYANLETVFSNGDETTKRREIIKILPVKELTVIGKIENGTIKSGEPFIIANAGKDQILEQMVSTEKTIYWVIKIACLLGLIIGFHLILGPILTIIGVIPILGSVTKFGVFLVSLVLGIVIVALVSLVSKFWYVVVILIVALIVWLIYKVMQKKNESPPKPAEPEEKP